MPTVAGVSHGRHSAFSGLTLTISHTTPAGSDRGLLVLFSAESSGDTCTGVTYGGVSLTLVGNVANSGGARAAYYLANPAVGTANVVCTKAGQVGGATAACHAINDTGGVRGSYVNATANSLTPALTVPAVTGDLIVDHVSTGRSQTYTPDPAQTLLYAQNGISNQTQGGSSKPGATSVSMAWTLTGSGIWAHGGVALQPAGAPTDVRLTSLYTEALTQAAVADVRLTSLYTEALIYIPPADAQVTQFAVETVTLPTPEGRVTQFVVEVLARPETTGRVTQFVVETISPYTPGGGGVGNSIWLGDHGGDIWIE